MFFTVDPRRADIPGEQSGDGATRTHSLSKPPGIVNTVSPNAPAILIGSRRTVAMLAAQLRALTQSPPTIRPIGCLLTDVTNECFVGRVPVLGAVADLARAHGTFGFRVGVISLPSDQSRLSDRLAAQLRELGVAVRIATPLDEMLTSDPTRAANTAVALPAKDIKVAELIGRVPYGIDRSAVQRVLGGKRILITGAGGSIGSEIARIAAAFRPDRLILMERSENALFEIDRQLARAFPDVPRSAILHDVVDGEETRRHLRELRPHAIFHAAAHKHVPLMEDHPAHAVKNNLFGTKAIADAALDCGAERFVLVSSDKAVNPTSVMGATKRLAEIYIQAIARRNLPGKPPTRFSMVRFGNVLGSACSVLPIWAAQLAEGGPLTVTDPRMTRYFMTIHEAAALVIQSSAIERAPTQAGLFVLDMGEPVRIVDLACRFARSFGLEPVVLPVGESGPLLRPGEVAITLTGARPGEKLHEELAYAAENLAPTPFAGIRAWAGSLTEAINPAEMIAELGSVRPSHPRDEVVRAIQKHVPEMRPDILRSLGSASKSLAA